MGLFRRAKRESRIESNAVLLEDQHLMYRIDTLRSGEWQGDMAKHPDACRACGWIQPGFRHCRRCGQDTERKAKYGRFWFQEVAGAGDRQEALERAVAGMERDASGGVHQWVNAILIPEPDNKRDKSAVKVVVLHGEDLDHVGYIPRDEAPAIQKACLRVHATYKRVVACKGLVQGGSLGGDGFNASYEIRVLLPPPWTIINLTSASLVLRPGGGL